MKKSVIAVGIVIALGAGWVGATWFTGKQIEERKEISTAAANQELVTTLQVITAMDTNLSLMMPNLQLYLDSYDRGLFSSTARYYLNEVGDKNKDDRVYFTAKIEHGPFPISELMAFNVMPQGAAISVELEKNAQTQPLFDITNGQAPFVLKIVPGMSTTRSDVTIASVNYQGVKLSDTSLQVIAQNDKSVIKSSMQIGNLSVGLPEGMVTMNGLAINSNQTQGKFVNYLTDQTMKIKEVSFKPKRSGPGSVQIAFENIAGQSKMTEDNVNAQYDSQMEFGNIKVANADLGTIKFGMNISQVDGATLKKITNDLMQAQATAKLTPELMLESLMNNIDGLFKNGPILKLSPVSWSNKSGTSSYSTVIELNKLSVASLTNLRDDQLIEKIVNNANADLTLSIPMIKEMVINTVQGVNLASKEDAEKQFDKTIAQLPTYLTQFDKKNILKINGNNVESHFNYSNGTVTLNDKKMPLADFVETMK